MEGLVDVNTRYKEQESTQHSIGNDALYSLYGMQSKTQPVCNKYRNQSKQAHNQNIPGWLYTFIYIFIKI